MNKFRNTLLLQLLMIVYSCGSIASKLASREEFLSYKYIIYMGLLFLSLAFFAVAWQQILKKVPLSFAYINKATTIIWGLIISVSFFNERITVTNVIGILIITIGIIISACGDENE